GAFTRAPVQTRTLLGDDAPAPLAVARGIRQVPADLVDELPGSLRDANGLVARDVDVVREAVVPPGRALERAGLFAVERDVHDRRVDDRRFDRQRRGDVHDDVAVPHRVGQMLLARGREVDGHAVAGLHRLPEWLL